MARHEEDEVREESVEVSYAQGSSNTRGEGGKKDTITEDSGVRSESTKPSKVSSRESLTKQQRIVDSSGTRSLRDQRPHWNKIRAMSLHEMGRTEALRTLLQMEQLYQNTLRDLQLATTERDEALIARDRANVQRKEAVEGRRNLLQRLESPIVKRKDPPSEPGHFPNGQQLQQMFRTCREHFLECLSQLSYIMHGDPDVNIFKDVAECVLFPCGSIAENHATRLFKERGEILSSFLQDGTNTLEHTNPLVNRLVTSTMQRVVQEWSAAIKHETIETWCKDSETVQKWLKNSEMEHWIRWACFSDDVKKGWEGEDIPHFMKTYFSLVLFCRFSDPQCYMWPPVGSRLEFSRATQLQYTNSVLRNKAKARDTVIVLFPGFYYQNPCLDRDKNPDPIEKAVVMVVAKEAAKSFCSLWHEA